MSNIFDGHCDTIYELCKNNGDLVKNNNHIDIERMSEFNTYIQVFAAFIDKKNIKQSPLNECLKIIEKYIYETEKNKELITPIKNSEDLKKSEAGGVYSILSIEGGEAFEGEISNIKMFYDLGVRLVTLTWNYANEIADGITEKRGGGLTDFGRKAVSFMENLGIMIDVSHLSVKGFWDVVECTKYPFVASHSCVKNICSNPRNLDDAQIKAIIDRNGFIGINFYPPFLSDGKLCGIKDIYKHIEYVLDKGGEDVVGFGSDFDGVDSLPHGVNDISDMRNVISGLKEINLSEKQIEKIAFGNLYRLFYDMLKRKADKIINI